MSLSDRELILAVQKKQLHPKRKGQISQECALTILKFIRVDPLERGSMNSLVEETGLSKTKIYTVIRDFKELGVTYESVSTGFKGVYERRVYQQKQQEKQKLV